MSADVEQMMYVGKVPWHGQGVYFPMEVNSETAIVAGGLDWPVEVAPIVTDDQKRTAVEQKRITRRVTDNAILGIVPKNFRPIQNRAAFAMFDNVVGRGLARYHTAGSLQGGSKVFIVAKLPEPLVVGKDQGMDDVVEKYLLLSNAHDGTRPLQMLFTPIRVVCSNTLNMALNSEVLDPALALAPRVTVRHTVRAAAQMKEAERTMGFAMRYYERFGNFSNFLASRQVSSQQVDNVVQMVFPPNKKMEVTETIADHRDSVTSLFTGGKGHDRIAGTAWALLNAFGEYADHGYAAENAKDDADRSYSVLMGGARGMKNRATKHIAEMLAA